MDVTAVVVVAARTGPVDALTELGGVPMVALAARALLATGLVDRVRLHDLGDRPGDLARACAGLPVDVAAGTHAPQRVDAADGDEPFAFRASGVLLLHDAARPLAPASLGEAVVEGVRSGHAVSVPVLPLSDTVKSVDPAGTVVSTPDRDGLRVLQTPVAVHADAVTGDLADPVEVVRRFLAQGATVHTVPGAAAAFAVRSAWDLELAQQLVERTMAG